MKAMQEKNYSLLVTGIGLLLEKGRGQAFSMLNSIIIETYWNIGKKIVEFEQGGKKRAKYGQALLKRISFDLGQDYGRGVSRSNLQYMRLFYLQYPICQTSGKLSWSHYAELISISSRIFASRYMLSLPSPDELKLLVEQAECKAIEISKEDSDEPKRG